MRRQSMERGREVGKPQSAAYEEGNRLGKYKYKTIGKRAWDGFHPNFAAYYSITYRILIFWSFELRKCSLKYEPTVFNINTNVKVGITYDMCTTFGGGYRYAVYVGSLCVQHNLVDLVSHCRRFEG